MMPTLLGPDGQPIRKQQQFEMPDGVMINTVKREINSRVFQMTGIVFPKLCRPHGMLHESIACHACFAYAIEAKKMAEETATTDGRIQLEDEPWPEEVFDRKYKGVLFRYGIEHAEFAYHWYCVDMQFDILKVARLGEKFRMRR